MSSSRKMKAANLDTRDICKLMDRMEREKIQKSEWSYGGGRTLQDVWSSKSILGNSGTQSLLEAFQNSNKRIVTEIYCIPEGTHVGGKTLPEFRELWSGFCEETSPLKPFRMPDKMVYTRTFRFSERALNYYGQSVHNEFSQAQLDGNGIEFSTFYKLISKLAKRNDAMIVLAFDSFDDARKQCGMAIVIDCIPVLETLDPDFTVDDIEFFRINDINAMLELLKLDKNDPEERDRALREYKENFNNKLYSTFKEMPGFPSPTVLSKLVKVPVRVFSMEHDPENPEEVMVDTLKVPRGAITLSRVDRKFGMELMTAFARARNDEWVKLRKWRCEACRGPANHLIIHLGAQGDRDFPVDAPVSVFLFPVCDGEARNCSMVVRQMIDMSMNMFKQEVPKSKLVKLCEYCEKVEPKGKKFRVCARCKMACYCSRECQTIHWKKGHKKVCREPPGLNDRFPPMAP